MKLQQLEYVITIAQEGSITAAAKKLYQAQPNISIALKELESEIGMQIFWRTPNGMVLTPEGEEFLVRAKEIVESMHNLESDYAKKDNDGVMIKIAAPRSPYLAAAVGLWINTLSDKERLSIHLLETHPHRVVEETSSGKADIGVMRIPASQAAVFASQLESRKLICRTLTEFSMKLLMRADHPLAKYNDVPFEELRKYTEIVHGDDELNTFGRNCINPDYDTDTNRKLVYVYDRGSKMSLINTINGAYMWVSPMPKQALVDDGAVIRDCSFAKVRMRDMLVCKKNSENNRLIKDCMDFITVFTAKVFE